MRVLLVEDDQALSEALSSSLRTANFVVDCVHNGQSALTTLLAEQTDMVILDLGLPDMDGLDVLRKLRRKHPSLPVLILTARDKTNDKISGLDAGADDYLPKPFEMAELLARLRVMERRLGTQNNTVITIGTVALDTLALSLSVDQQSVNLSRRELMLLKVLMENAGRIQSKQQLESRLYEWGDEISSNAIEVHIHNLRKKLPDGFIKTIRGVGYCVQAKGASA